MDNQPTHYIDAARLLTTVQKGKRARIIYWPEVKEAIHRVIAGIKFIGLDGGTVPIDYCYPAETTLAIVSHNSKGQIVFGVQRCKALRDKNSIVHSLYSPTTLATKIYNEEALNRGKWHLLTGFDVVKWADFIDESKVVVL